MRSWHLVALALLLCTTHAWHADSDGKVQRDSHCAFHGLDLLNQQTLSDKCGDICDVVPNCTHWTWTSYLGGTCWLKQGASNRAYVSADTNCGFIAARFEVDVSRGFDLGAGISGDESKQASHNTLSADDADTLLRILNFYRLAYSKPALSVDARLVLAAKDLANACPPKQVDPKTYIESAPVPIAADYGFHTNVFQLSLAAPLSVGLGDALVAWGNVSDPASKPLLEAPTTRIGCAARRNTQCVSTMTTTPATAVDSSSNADASALATVYVVLLAVV